MSIILYLQLLKEIPCLLTSSHVSLEFPICILQPMCHINYSRYKILYIEPALNFVHDITLF